MDPPPSFKAGWKAVRLEEALGSTDITFTTGNIYTALATLGIQANSVKILKVAVWVTPGTAANTNKPTVILAMRDPIGGGSLGSRADTGQLSRAAHVQYSFADAIRDVSFDLPSSGAGVTYGQIQASAASGVLQVSIEYNI